MTKKMAQKTMKETKEMNTMMVKGIAIPSRGRTFQGYVTKKFDNRVVVEFERTVYYPKYERYAKKKTRLHARIPDAMEVHQGDYVKVQECRPLSKIIHFIVISIVRRNQ